MVEVNFAEIAAAQDFKRNQDPSRYYNPSDVSDERGRTLAGAVPHGPMGMLGVVVRGSDMQGQPIGMPSNPVIPRLVVDPGHPDGGFMVDFTQIDQAELRQVVAETRHLIRSRPDQRLVAQKILKAFSQDQENRGLLKQSHVPQNSPTNRFGFAVSQPGRSGYVVGEHAVNGRVPEGVQPVIVEQCVEGRTANMPAARQWQEPVGNLETAINHQVENTMYPAPQLKAPDVAAPIKAVSFDPPTAVPPQPVTCRHSHCRPPSKCRLCRRRQPHYRRCSSGTRPPASLCFRRLFKRLQRPLWSIRQYASRCLLKVRPLTWNRRTTLFCGRIKAWFWSWTSGTPGRRCSHAPPNRVSRCGW